MKKENKIQFWVSLLTIQAFILNPLMVTTSNANLVDDYHKTCDPVYQAANSNSPSANSALQLRGECDKAKLAVNARKVESAKVIMFGTAAAVCTAMTISLLPASDKVCQGLTLATSGTAFILDKTTASGNAAVVGSFASSVQPVASAFGALSSGALLAGKSNFIGKMLGGKGDKFTEAGRFIGGSGKAAKAAEQSAFGNKMATLDNSKESLELADKEGKAAKNAAYEKDKSQQKKNSCLMSAITMGVQAAISGIGLSAANKALKTSSTSATETKTAIQSSLSLSLKSGADAPVKTTGPIVPSTGDLETTCATKTADAHIRCIAEGSHSPELSAVVNNPAFMNTMQSALGGKNLGDFVKDFKGESQQDAADYIAKGLGMGEQGGLAVAKLMDAQSKLAQNIGATDAYQTATYSGVASNSAQDLKSDDMDFNKMMSDMMKQLNPGEEISTASKDPSEIVFHQMDLLPPEKIEENKNISLFARIGYRYRKKANEVEQLNWSSEQNRSTASEQ